MESIGEHIFQIEGKYVAIFELSSKVILTVRDSVFDSQKKYVSLRNNKYMIYLSDVAFTRLLNLEKSDKKAVYLNTSTKAKNTSDGGVKISKLSDTIILSPAEIENLEGCKDMITQLIFSPLSIEQIESAKSLNATSNTSDKLDTINEESDDENHEGDKQSVSTEENNDSKTEEKAMSVKQKGVKSCTGDLSSDEETLVIDSSETEDY